MGEPTPSQLLVLEARAVAAAAPAGKSELAAEEPAAEEPAAEESRAQSLVTKNLPVLQLSVKDCGLWGTALPKSAGFPLSIWSPLSARPP